MNGIEKIKSEILAEAEEYAKLAFERCDEQCARIKETERKRAEKLCVDEEKNFISERKAITERTKSSAETLRNNILLDAKNQKINEIFALTAQYLTELDENIYIVFLKNSLKNAIAILPSFPDGKYILSLNERDTGRFGNILIQSSEVSITLSGVHSNISGGFILTVDGHIGDCSLEALLKEVRLQEKNKLHAILFE